MNKCIYNNCDEKYGVYDGHEIMINGCANVDTNNKTTINNIHIYIYTCIILIVTRS